MLEEKLFGPAATLLQPRIRQAAATMKRRWAELVHALESMGPETRMHWSALTTGG